MNPQYTTDPSDQPSATPPLHAAPERPTNGTLKNHLVAKVDDAERLLAYAADMGIEVEDQVRSTIIEARLAAPDGLSKDMSIALLSALTKLSAKLKPVTAESLKICSSPRWAKAVARCYMAIAIVLISIVVPYSILSFVSSGLAEKIARDITNANALAVKLSDELEPAQKDFVPPEGSRGIYKPLPAGVTSKDVITD